MAVFLSTLYVLFVAYLMRGQRFILVFIMLFPMIIVSAIRDFGPDTEVYEYIFYNSTAFDNVLAIFYEPILQLFIYLVRDVFQLDHRWFFGIHAGLITVIFSYILSCGRKWYYYIFSIGVVVYLNSIFNGMRIGLAYHLLLLGVHFSQRKYFIFLGTLSHLSTIMVIYLNSIYDFFHKASNSNIIRFLLISGGGLLLYLYLLSLNLPQVFSKKIEVYSVMMAPNIYSGIMEICVILITLLLIRKDRRRRFELNFVIYLIGFAFVIGLYTLGQQSYGWLRIIKILMVVFVASASRFINCRARIPLLGMGLIYITNYVRVSI